MYIYVHASPHGLPHSFIIEVKSDKHDSAEGYKVTFCTRHDCQGTGYIYFVF